MTQQTTIDMLRAMRMSAMAAEFEKQMGDPAFRELGFEDRLGLLVNAEWNRRQSNKVERFEYSAPRKPPVRRFGNRRSGDLETVIPANRKPLLSVGEPLIQSQKGRCPAAQFVPQRSGPGAITRSGSCLARTPPA